MSRWHVQISPNQGEQRQLVSDTERCLWKQGQSSHFWTAYKDNFLHLDKSISYTLSGSLQMCLWCSSAKQRQSHQVHWMEYLAAGLEDEVQAVQELMTICTKSDSQNCLGHYRAGE